MGYKFAVLMGGQSFEREFSLFSGQFVCQELEDLGHYVLPLDTDLDLVNTLRSEKVDAVYIALHGKHGEDGTVQSLLHFLDIPYVGCDESVCMLTRNKSAIPVVLSATRTEKENGIADWPKQICLGIDTFKVMGAASALDMVSKHIPAYPLAVKPGSGSSAMGVHKVHNFDELAPSILDALSYDDKVIISEWADGIELSVSIIEHEDGNLEVLPPVEIVSKHEYFDNADRFDLEEVEFFSPPENQDFLKGDIIEKIKAAGIEVFKAFKCRDMVRIDIIWDMISPKVIDVDVSPGMAASSLFPTACKAAGLKLGKVLEELLCKAMDRNN